MISEAAKELMKSIIKYLARINLFNKLINLKIIQEIWPSIQKLNIS